jgi:Flp pilus assembly protein TadD
MDRVACKELSYSSPAMQQITLDQALKIAFQHYEAGRLRQAEQVCRLILAKQPTHADTLNLLGVVAFGTGRTDLGLDLIRRAIVVNPASAEYQTNLGNLLRTVGQTTAAIEAYGNAIKLRPEMAEAYSNLGNALSDQGDLEKAIDCHQTAIRLNPNLLEAYSNLGNTLTDLGQPDEAIAAYRAALALKAYHPAVRANLAMCLLLKGDYAAGWREYEWRWGFEGLADGSRPIWDGNELNGRTILLRAEQGLGDTIQFIRYLPLVAARSGRVVVECQPELIGILKQIASVALWIPMGDPLPDYDVWRPLLSLPSVFGTTLDNIPRLAPALKASADATENFRRVLASCPDGPKVGLVWAGRSEHKNDRNRSIALSVMAELANVPNVHFVSLQKGPAAAQAREIASTFQLIDLTDQLQDFADTAALIENLDLVISVDTSVAHLAGAMGKPVWLLLPFAPDWRWMTDRSDSPWYPSMRLFRQSRIGDWSDVIPHVAERLKDLTKDNQEWRNATMEPGQGGSQ